MLTKEQIQAYASMDKWGVIYSENGYAAGLFALGAELYVSPRERLQLQLDMLDVQEDYYRRFYEYLDVMRYHPKNEESKVVKLNKGENPIPMARNALGVHPQEAYCNVLWKMDFRHPDFPDRKKFQITPWSSEYFVQSEGEYGKDDLHYYASSIPVSNGKGKLHFDLWRECVLAWAKRLKPAHGQAGLTILMSDFMDGPYTLPTLQKYPGLDIQVPLVFSGAVKGAFNRIKCVNWLTILGEELLDDLGGMFVLKNALEPLCTLYSYPGGVLIQAGEAPRLGDVELPGAFELLEPYRKIAFITKRVRFMNYTSSLFRVNEPLIGKEEAKKWVSRFD